MTRGHRLGMLVNGHWFTYSLYKRLPNGLSLSKVYWRINVPLKTWGYT